MDTVAVHKAIKARVVRAGKLPVHRQVALHQRTREGDIAPSPSRTDDPSSCVAKESQHFLLGDFVHSRSSVWRWKVIRPHFRVTEFEIPKSVPGHPLSREWQ